MATQLNELSQEEILHIATLANISLASEEVEKYQKQLIETISYVENLKELDTTGVEATSHSTRVTNVFFEDGSQNERQFSQEEALKNGKNTRDSMFSVKKIM